MIGEVGGVRFAGGHDLAAAAPALSPFRPAEWEPGRMPTDPVTGLPYAILPGNEMDRDGLPLPTNYHHHFYNRRDPDLEGNHHLDPVQLAIPELIPLEVIAGLSVRISRGQHLPVPTHNRAHRLHPLGPNLPHTIPDKFATAAKACSGLVSRWALDVWAPDGPGLVYMDDETFERVASPRLLCTEKVYYDKPANHRRRILGSFFLRYAAMQDLSHISGRVVDEFLHTKVDSRRLALGNLILRDAMDLSLAPILPEYRELRAKGMVHPGRPSLKSAIWKYIHPERRPVVFRVLKARLAA